MFYQSIPDTKEKYFIEEIQSKYSKASKIFHTIPYLGTVQAAFTGSLILSTGSNRRDLFVPKVFSATNGDGKLPLVINSGVG